MQNLTQATKQPFGWRVLFSFLCILQIILQAPASVHADSDEASERPKIGLVLAGGGARGGAHIGVLQMLEEHRVPIDYIAGTSFGAIVGSLYASGYSADELEIALEGLDWAELLSDSAPRRHRSMQRKLDDNDATIDFEIGYKDGEFKLPSGLVRGNQLRLKLAELMSGSLKAQHFDDLPIPFRAIAADLLTGEQVIMEDGDLASAVIASMSVPGLFPPFEYGDRLLVDGGIVNNVPVDVARSMGADIVIVVDISAPPAERKDITSFTKVLSQMVNLLTRKSRQAQLETLADHDILIKPDTTGISLTAFTKTLDMVQKGKLATEAELPSLQKLQLSHAGWQQYLMSKKPLMLDDQIDFIRIKNASRLASSFIEEHISQRPGDKLDQQALAEDLTRIYGTGDFESLDYHIVKDGGETGLEIVAKDRAVGNDYLQFGVSLEDDFTGTSNYNITGIYTKRGINELGAEWRNKATLGNTLRFETQFYQPLDNQQRFFAFTSAGLYRTTIGTVDDDGGEASDVLIEALTAQVGGGYTFSNWGRLTVGLQRTDVDLEFLSSVPDFGGVTITSGDKFNVQETSLFASFFLDTLDNANFPTSGTRLSLNYTNNQTFLGGDSEVNSVSAGVVQAVRFGANTFVGWLNMGSAYGGAQTPSDNFSLGGFRNLSGLRKEEISGRYMGIAGFEYRRLINQDGLNRLFGVPLYAGLTLEAGNVWNRSEDISLGDLRWGGSLFLGADTPFGPLYVGTGYTNGGNTSAFLFLGAQF